MGARNVFLQNVLNVNGYHPVSFSICTWGSFLALQRPGHEFHYSAASSEVSKREWPCTSTPSLRLHLMVSGKIYILHLTVYFFPKMRDSLHSNVIFASGNCFRFYLLHINFATHLITSSHPLTNKHALCILKTAGLVL